MRILAVSGSLRAASSNTALLKAAASLAPEGVAVTLFEGLDALPHFNPDREFEPNSAVGAWREALKACDALLISSPEYAHGIPGVMKNALDWVVGSGELVDKRVGILDATASPQGQSFAHDALVEVLRVMSAKVIPDAVLHIPALRNKIGPDGSLADEGTKFALKLILKALIA